MGLWNRVKNAFSWSNSETESYWKTIKTSDGWSFTSSSSYDASEVTYYICMKILAESVAKLSLHLKDKDSQKIYGKDVNRLLQVRPNAYMSPTDFKMLMEYNRNHFGNSYAYIETDRNGRRIGLHPLDPTRMRILVDDANILKAEKGYLYIYHYGGKKYKFSDKDIIHLKGGLSKTGISGKSVLEELGSTIEGAQESQKYLNDLYRRGLTANAVIQYTGDLSDEKKKKLVSTITEFARSEDSGNIVPIPFGMDLKPLDIKLTDAQFFELKKFNALQIAAAFGVKPNHLNNYDKSSYANSEMQNLTFYIDTLLVILRKWEEELDYKLLYADETAEGMHTEFNVSTILRGDLKSQAEALNTYVTGSIYTTNEARAYLGLPAIDGGDAILVNGSYVGLDRLGAAYESTDEGGDRSD